MIDISLDATVDPGSEVFAQDLPDGEIVLLNMANESYFGLDGVGARMWSELSSGRTLREVADVLCDEFDAEPASVQDDLKELVDHLVSEGLVTIQDG